MRSSLIRPALLAIALFGLGGQACAAEAALRPCRLRGLEHDAQCGVLTRPLDPANPKGVQIDVHFAVVPALARNKKADPVFFFAGGPGQSAIDLAGPVSVLMARFSNRRDIVLVDQRGTGLSAPLKCDGDDAGRPLAQTLDPSRQAQQLATCRVALQKLPYGDLRQFTTSIAMQDVDAVRAAMGAEQVNAVGGSYGTRAVLEYMRQFPQRVRRAVIDGVAPPDMVLPASFSTDNQAALEALFVSCETQTACAARHPQLRARWQQLLSGLPRAVTIQHPVTGRSEPLTVTRELVLSMVRAPLYRPVLASGLPQAIEDGAAGRFETLATLGASLLGRRKEMALAEGMHFSVVCAEDVPRLAQSSDKSGADFGDTFAQLYRQVCADWPRGQVPEDFYRMPPARVATLVLSGAVDPVTPPRHGERVAKALGAKARHVVAPNTGHGVMAVGCMRDVIFRFVDAPADDEALKVDAQCVQALPRPPAFVPIQPPAASASAANVPPVAQGAAR